MISRSFHEAQGIRQGGVSSTVLFNNRSTTLLEKLGLSPDGFRIGHIRLGAVMCADDLALISETHAGMQCLVNEAANDASRERFNFSEKKTKLMDIKPKATSAKSPGDIVSLYGSSLESAASEKHLGIMRTSDGKNSSTINERVKVARRTAYGLMGAGLHGLNGVSPEVNLKIFNTYVMPRLIFGLKSVVLCASEIKTLENFYRGYLRCCQHLPESTAKPAIYLLSGALPLEGHLHIEILSFVASMARRTNSVEWEILQRQIAMKDMGGPSWVKMAQSIIEEYNLPSIRDLLYNPPTKSHWKILVQSTVRASWEKRLKDEAKQMSSLHYLVTDACKLGHTHRVWSLEGRSSLEVVKATVKAKLLVSRYPLYSCRVSGKFYKAPCPLCSAQDETVEHFLLCCPALECDRRPIMNSILSVIPDFNFSRDPECLTKVLLDSSAYISSDPLAERIEELSRNLCYKLHYRRSILIGGCKFKIPRPRERRL